jgi:ppGpp synthetase/RelA/SpoT-type nucleotidyltranferase
MGRPFLTDRPNQQGTEPQRRQGPTLRGLSLGWRLGLTTALIVTVVLGILTLSNRLREIHKGWQDRDLLLQESLVSLASELEQASSLDEIGRRLAEFQEAYAERGYAGHQVVLRDLHGRILASAGSGPRKPDSAWVLRASLPVYSSLLPQGQGVLAVRQNASAFEKEAHEDWFVSLVDIIVTGLCIVLCLLVAEYYLVARPLRQLLAGIHQMEMGYWGGLQVPKGAREIRWLARRFQKLGGDLEETMRRLVDAQRRALGDLSERPKPPLRGAAPEAGGAGTPPSRALEAHAKSPGAEPPRLEEDLLLQYLSDKCRLLESGSPSDPEMRAYAKEAWERDVIVAERLGALYLKSRLEDASLRVLNPEAFSAIRHSLANLVAGRKEWLQEQDAQIRQALEGHGIPFLEVQHRVKHVGSLWRKVHAKGLRLEQVHDIFAFRIIVAEERDCYRVLRALHEQFDPRLLRFKDYIANPKPSGYQSLHTCLRSRQGFLFEVQIRTLEMHERAEGGTAAHWRYKYPLTDPGPSRGSVGGLRRLLSGVRRSLARFRP